METSNSMASHHPLGNAVVLGRTLNGIHMSSYVQTVQGV
jgi:hypothetical protein